MAEVLTGQDHPNRSPALDLGTAASNIDAYIRGAMKSAGTGIACKSKSTKRPELTFRIVLSDGAQETRFERLLAP
jgi:hypothetical protein